LEDVLDLYELLSPLGAKAFKPRPCPRTDKSLPLGMRIAESYDDHRSRNRYCDYQKRSINRLNSVLSLCINLQKRKIEFQLLRTIALATAHDALQKGTTRPLVAKAIIATHHFRK
jgi:hypothetical protein